MLNKNKKIFISFLKDKYKINFKNNKLEKFIPNRFFNIFIFGSSLISIYFIFMNAIFLSKKRIINL